MKLQELFEMQEKLDQAILRQPYETLPTERQREILTNIFLALQVETSELANVTRCFKHWSKKGPEAKEIQLDEYADILHFLLSLGLKLGFTADEVETAYCIKHQVNYDRIREGY